MDPKGIESVIDAALDKGEWATKEVERLTAERDEALARTRALEEAAHPIACEVRWLESRYHLTAPEGDGWRLFLLGMSTDLRFGDLRRLAALLK